MIHARPRKSSRQDLKTKTNHPSPKIVLNTVLVLLRTHTHLMCESVHYMFTHLMKGLQLEVAALRTPKLLVSLYSVQISSSASHRVQKMVKILKI